MADEENTGAAPDMASANTLYRQLVAAGAAPETAEAALLLPQLLLERILGVEPIRFDPECADAWAPSLGTPNAAGFRAAAKQLASEFGITKADDLCTILQHGIYMSKALKGDLEPTTINGQKGYVLSSALDCEKELVGDLEKVLEKLHQLQIARDLRASDKLVEAITAYLKAYTPHEKMHRGKNPPHKGYGIIVLLAQNYEYLTGKKLCSDESAKATKGGRGPIYGFAKAACEAVGIEAPSDRIIDRCLEAEGLRILRHEKRP